MSGAEELGKGDKEGVMSEAITVEFGKPYVPPAGEHDVYVQDLRVGDSKYGKVLYLDLLLLDEGEDKGEGFTLLYGLPRPGRKLSSQSKLGQLLVQMGLPVEDWASRGVQVDLREVLQGKRLRVVTGVTVKQGAAGPLEVATLAAVKKVYAEGEGPSLPDGIAPF